MNSTTEKHCKVIQKKVVTEVNNEKNYRWYFNYYHSGVCDEILFFILHADESYF